MQDFFNEAVNFSASIDFNQSQVVETVRSALLLLAFRSHVLDLLTMHMIL